MKLSRLILPIVMILGFSSYAGATIINLGSGAFYYMGLTITQPQDLVNSYLSQTWPALTVSSTLPVSGGVNLSDAGLKQAVYQVSLPVNLGTATLNKIKTAGVGPTGSNGSGQSGSNDNYAAPVPEPATMLLLGTGLVMFAGTIKKLRWLP